MKLRLQADFSVPLAIKHGFGVGAGVKKEGMVREKAGVMVL